MALRFVLGRAGSGKSHFCLEEIRAELRLDPLGDPLILLVPEQATYQMELQLAATPDLGGMLRAQVLSFRRLGWRVIAESGGRQGVVLGELGKCMLLRRILLQKQGELKILANSARRPGMAELLAGAIAEFKAYRLKPEDLREAAAGSGGKLGEKLGDLALIYSEFQRVLHEGMQDPDDSLSFTAEKLAQAQTPRQARVWVDGFKGFTPQELLVLDRLLSVGREVTVTLPLDPEVLRRASVAEEVLKPGEELFFTPWQTYQALRRLAFAQGTERVEIVGLTEIKRPIGPRLAHLERYFTLYPTAVCERDAANPRSDLKKAEIRLGAAVNRRAEVEGVAREIRRLVRDEGVRWHEIGVLTRDMQSYGPLIGDVFQMYEIPVFMDYRRTVNHHPLLEFVQSALEIVRSNWAFEPVFRCLKTGFFPLSRDLVDCLENRCLEYGIEGRGWLVAEKWHNRHSHAGEESAGGTRGLEERIETARQTIVSLLSPFTEQLQALGDGTVRRLAGEVYALLESMEIPEQLEYWAKHSDEKGEFDEARLQSQMWDGVLSVLDELVTGLGEESLTLEDFALIFASGLESLQLGLIPPALDQVLAGTLERSRNPEVRVLFLLGGNEGVLPARPTEHGVLDASEREELAGQGLELAPFGQAQWADEQFYLYSALTRAREQLVLSYSLSDEDGKGMVPSPVVKRLRTMFPSLREELWGVKSADLEQISHPTPLLPEYALQLRAAGEVGNLPPLWQSVRRWFLQDSSRAPLIRLLEGGALEGRQEEKLPQRLTRRLYGKKLRVSVSRLEQFNSCPFAHFAHYGLRLRERPVHRLASPDLGLFFHRLLHDFAQTVRQDRLDWGSLSKEESWQILSRLTEQVAPELQHEILLSNARYRYLTQKLKKTVHQAISILAQHARLGRFVPIGLEVRFGEEGLPSGEISLRDGTSLLLVGQIDRIDAVCLEGKVYLRVLDYKSQAQSLSLDRVYHGLNLQLLTYLDVSLQGAEVLIRGAEEVLGLASGEAAGAEPAGFLYFPVINPLLDSPVPLPKEQVEQERVKAVKVDGFLLADQKVLQAMDQMLAEGGSDLLRLKLTKDGDFRQGAKVLSAEQFSLLRSHLREVVEKAGDKIMAGEIAIRPYRLGRLTGCQYCDYSSVCHFGEDMPDYPYRALPRLKNEEIWQRLRAGSSGTDSAELGTETAGVELPGVFNATQGKALENDGEVNWLEGRRGDLE